MTSKWLGRAVGFTLLMTTLQTAAEPTERIGAFATAATDRDPDPQGVARQGAALIVLADLRARLTAIKSPTVVMHGSDDPLISPRSGREVADAIPGARFILLEGMGQDLPLALLTKCSMPSEP